MNMENISSIGVTIGGGFFAGILIGYALKKVVKLVAVVAGLFFAGLAYLQYQQIVNINWNKLQEILFGYYRGARYGRPLPETGNMFYTTQAWAVLSKCWKGYKIAKGQDDLKKMKYYAQGIRKAQRELGLEVDNFPDLGLYCTDENGSDPAAVEEEAPYDYENPAQRRWRERINAYYHA